MHEPNDVNVVKCNVNTSLTNAYNTTATHEWPCSNSPPPRGRRRWRPLPGVDLDPPPLHASAAQVCMSWRGPRACGRAVPRLIAAVGEAGG